MKVCPTSLHVFLDLEKEFNRILQCPVGGALRVCGIGLIAVGFPSPVQLQPDLGSHCCQ